MTIRSYAQNFEDVLLHRALRDVDQGRYIDVGAGHPDLHSVTKLFYELGWSGINVEPVPTFARALGERRPRDINLHAAVVPGTASAVELVVVEGWEELSTTDAPRTDELQADGRELTRLVVPAVRLSDVVGVWGDGDVHFLKVDVEGGELDVITTLDLATVRPWIVVVEVVSANSASKKRDDIRTHMEANGYVVVYFDGLNDFYVAREHADRLSASFAVPVNIQDDFVTDSAAAATVDVLAGLLGMETPANPSELQQRVEALLGDRIRFEVEARTADAAVAELRQEIAARGAETIADLRAENEALEQALFERDRLISAHTAAAARMYGAQAAQVGDLQGQVSGLEAQVAGLEARIAGLLSSTSWRLTLPLRVLRRPGTYLRARAGR